MHGANLVQANLFLNAADFVCRYAVEWHKLDHPSLSRQLSEALINLAHRGRIALRQIPRHHSAARSRFVIRQVMYGERPQHLPYRLLTSGQITVAVTIITLELGNNLI